MMRLAVLVGVMAGMLIATAASAAATERCCLLVDARVSGRLSGTAGADLESAGAYSYRARWRWRVRHVVRYVEHGRIFNALTRIGAGPQGALSVQLSEERRSLRAPPCQRSVRRDLAGASDRAYASLEDTTDGKIALVLRAQHPALRARCRPAPAIPAAHVGPAPAGVVLRHAEALSVTWREPIRLHDAGPVVGSVGVQVKLRVIAPMRAKAALAAVAAD